MLELLRMNIRIIRMFNSCTRAEFTELLDEVIANPEAKAKKILSSKLYVWNLLRPRDYYKLMTYYIVNLLKIKDPETFDQRMDTAEFLLETVLSTAKTTRIRLDFIWNVTKHVPLLTVSTIKYMTPERITGILTSDKTIIADEFIEPFLTVIKQYRDEIGLLETQVETQIADQIVDGDE